jgi:hypothetical protein
MLQPPFLLLLARARDPFCSIAPRPDAHAVHVSSCRSPAPIQMNLQEAWRKHAEHAARELDDPKSTLRKSTGGTVFARPCPRLAPRSRLGSRLGSRLAARRGAPAAEHAPARSDGCTSSARSSGRHLAHALGWLHEAPTQPLAPTSTQAPSRTVQSHDCPNVHCSLGVSSKAARALRDKSPHSFLHHPAPGGEARQHQGLWLSSPPLASSLFSDSTSVCTLRAPFSWCRPSRGLAWAAAPRARRSQHHCVSCRQCLGCVQQELT